MSTPSRFEVEHLHRVMLQASVDAAALERRAREAEQDHGLRGLLRDWKDAVATLTQAFDRARVDLLRDGTGNEEILRIEDCLTFLRASVDGYESGDAVDEVVGRWQSLSFALSQLSGDQRDALVRLLARLQSQIDRATEGLGKAQQNGGLAPEKYRIASDLRAQADRAGEKYARLREEYLDAERAYQKWLAGQQAAARAAELARVQAEAAVNHQQVPQQFLDWHYKTGALKAAPAIVRLPDPRKPGNASELSSGSGRPGSNAALANKPPVLPKQAAPSTPSILSGHPKPPGSGLNPFVGPNRGGTRLDGKFSGAARPDKVLRGNLEQLSQFDPKVAAQVKHGLPGHFDPKVPQHGPPANSGLPQHAHHQSVLQTNAKPDRIIPGKHAPLEQPRPLHTSRPSIPSGMQPVPHHEAPSPRGLAKRDSAHHPAPFNPAVRPSYIVQAPQHRAFDGRLHGAPPQSLLRAQRPEPTRGAAAAKPSGPLRVSVERVERAAGFPSGVDGIGRGNQTAQIFFRAENLQGGLSVGGTHGVSLGASCRLEVAPMVTIFSSVPGAPLRGKLTLGLISSGGRLVGLKPREAHDLARAQARGAAQGVAEKVGPLGRELSSAIAAVLVDAADKIFARAQPGAAQQKLPPNHGAHQRGRPQAHQQQHGHKRHESHHLHHFNHALGEILHEAREAKAPGGQKHRKQGMHHLVHHEEHHQVASKLEKTLAHLATATHRVLTDTHAGELRGQLARLDALLSSLKGKAGHQLLEGTHSIGQVLSQMGGVVSSAGGAPHIASFRGLLNERRGQLAQIAGAARRQLGQDVALKHGKHAFQMPSAQVLGEKALEALRKQHPGIEKLLRNASHSQLAQELARKGKGGLEELFEGGHGHHGGHGRHQRRRGQHAAHGLGGVGLGGIGSALLGGGHLGGFGGGLHSMGPHVGALTRLFSHELEHQAKRAGASDIGKLLGHFKGAPHGSPLHTIARQAEERSKHLHAKHGGSKGKAPAHLTAQALVEAFKAHGKGNFASHVAPGGALYQICHTAQRTRGQQISGAASHFLQARGQSHLWNAVSTFHGLVKEGHKPHHSLWSWAKDRAASAVSTVTSVANVVTSGVSKVTSLASAASNSISSGLSSLGNRAFGAVSSVVNKGVGIGRGIFNFGSSVLDRGMGALHNMGDRLRTGVGNTWEHLKHQGSGLFGRLRNGLSNIGHGIGEMGHRLWDRASGLGQAAWAGMQRGAGALERGVRSGVGAIGRGATWAQHAYNSASHWVDDKVNRAGGFAGNLLHRAGDLAHRGIDWVNRTGVVGGIGRGLRGGMHLLGNAVKHSPLGMAARAGWGLVKNPLAKIWDKTKSVAGNAWGGIKSAYKATAGFLQSPAGQFLVTGLSLAASFIPGGILVKSLVGAGIGAIQAISEGKDLKGILLSAGSGALTGALPFLKLGPLAKVGMGALTGAVGSLAQGGSFKDALKAGAGGTLDAFDPGAMKALGKLKSLSAAQKLLKGGKLNELEKLAVSGGKMGGPLRLLEKSLANPKIRKTVTGLEKVGGRAVRGGIYVSGKAAKVQGVLDQALNMGDKLDGALQQIHDQAPGMAGFFGDNAVGHFIGKVGDYAGTGDEKLHKALEYGHTASDKLTQYRGYPDKGLNYVGVKDPAKAYEKMQARKALRDGRKGGAQHLAQLKLEAHKAKHPELYAATKAKGKHGGAAKHAPRHELAQHAAHGAGHGGHGKPAHHQPATGKGGKQHGNKPQTALERALAKGKELQKKGTAVAQWAHDKSGKLGAVVEKGLKGADAVQSGLEKASALAKQGAGLLGEDSELGRYLMEASEKAEAMHGYLETGIGYAETFQKGVGLAHDWSGKVPGVRDEEEGGGKKKHGAGYGHPLDHAQHLEGGAGKGKHKTGTTADHGPHGHPHQGKTNQKAPAGQKIVPHAHETEAAHARRMKDAWDALANVSAQVQRFDSAYAKRLEKVQQLLKSNQANAASIELQGLGSEAAEIAKVVSRARTLAKGNDGYEKEAKFYEEWAKKAQEKVHSAIADTKGLGAQVQISGFGIDEKSHADIFANTRDIYAVQAKVNAFGDALGDSSAKAQVEKVLAEAKAARSHLQALKSKYKSDRAAGKFLNDGGMQDKLIDESIARLEKALKGSAGGHAGPHGKAPHAPTGQAPGHKGHDVRKKSEHGLKALEAYRKKALKLGHKVDHNLAKVEHALKKGVAVGKKVDKGMEKIGSIADQVAGFLGEDTPLGHLAHQAAQTAHAGHDKLHSALGMAQKGKAGLTKGRDILHEVMDKAAAEHEKRQPRFPHGHPAHGPHGAHHADLHYVTHGRFPAPPAHGLHPHHPAHGQHPAHGLHPHQPAQPHHAAHGKPAGLHLPQLHLPHLAMPVWLKKLLGLDRHAAPGGTTPGPGKVDADPTALVQEAAKAVQEFGKAVTKTIGEVEKLMHAKKTKEAGDRVHAITGVSESTRAKVTAALTASAKHPALHKHAAALKAHYLEIRAHLFKFVHTLHGLGGDEGGGIDASRYPDIHQVAVAIDSLGVKVTALGDLQHGDSHLQASVKALQTEALALHKKLDALQVKHGKDNAAGSAIQGLYAKLGRLERMLSGHADPGNVQKGNHNLEVKPPEPTRHARRKQRRRPHAHDPISDVLGAGEEGRIFVDRGGNRGEADHSDGQEVDPAAVDTWLGSGEGVKLFSEVFGAFIPAEGAPKGGTSYNQQGHAADGGGEHDDPHYAHHGLGAPAHPAAGGGPARGAGVNQGGPARHGRNPARGMNRRAQRKGHRHHGRGKAGGGFFHDLFEHLEQFADGVTHAAQAGEGMLGKAMHYAEEGIHGLKAVESAAESVHGFAGKAEAFLARHHLGGAAHFAHQIGSAAGTVDKDAKLLQGGLTTADKWMGVGKKDLGAVEGLSQRASGAFRQAEHNHFGGLLNLFKASRGGDGIDGKLQPEKAQLGSNFDEPRRIDGGTLSKMEGFLGGDFAHVRIHTGPGAGIITRRFDAEAVTVKDHIFFAPGRFNTQSVEGQKLLAHELTHVKQMGRANLDVRTAEGEALRAEHSFGAPEMETLNLSQPQADFKLADGEGLGASTGIHTARRSRSKGHETGGKDELPDGEEFLEKVSNRVYDLLMEELEQSFESR